MVEATLLCNFAILRERAKKNKKLCKKVAKKFAKYNLFIVYLHRDSKEDRARKRDVRSANEMRSFFEGCLMLNV